MREHSSMESSILFQQGLENYKNLGDVVLLSSASACNVSVVDIISKSKSKEIAMARAIACFLLNELGFGTREISRLTSTDPKGVYTYIHSHYNRMADQRFKRAYGKAKKYSEDYYSSDASLHDEVAKVKARYIELESKYEHIKELLTSN